MFAVPRLLLRWCRLRISWLLLVLRRCLVVVALLLLLGVIIALLVLWSVTSLSAATSPTAALTTAGCV